MRHRSRAGLALIAAAPLLIGTAEADSDVSATVTGLRSAKGQVVACLTMRPDIFPDCQRDPTARALKTPAAQTVTLDFGRVPKGVYAIALFHDENGNGKLDKRLIIPREGYGFSRNAPVMMGPPRFASAAFATSGADHHETIRMRYIF